MRPAYNFDDDVTEWLDELGGAEAAERCLSALADRCAKAGEASKAYYYRQMAHQMRKIITGPEPVIVRRRGNA